MTEESVLTIEEALARLDLTGNNRARAFYCSKFSKEGVLVISDKKMDFGSLTDHPKELKFEEFSYNLLESIAIASGEKKSYLEFKYGHLKVKFYFYDHQEILEAKKLLETILRKQVSETEYKEFEPVKLGLNYHKKQEKKPAAGEAYKALQQTAVVSDKFLHLASTSVANFREKPVTLPPRPEKAAVEDQPLIAREPEKKALTELQPQVEKKKIGLKKESYTQLQQNARVNERFINTAAVTIEKQVPAKKGPGFFTSYKVKSFMMNLFYLAAIIIFFQTEYSKPVKNFITAIPGALKYGMNFIEAQRCELEILGIGKTIIYYYNSHQKNYPEDFAGHIRKNFKSNLKSDPAKDPWGSFYILETGEKGFRIISSGPDKKKGTSDDFINTFNLNAIPE